MHERRRHPPSLVLGTLMLSLPVGLVGCADDGNDQGLRLRQAAARAAELRAAEPVPEPEPSARPSGEADEPDPATDPATDPTTDATAVEPTVEPTGVVIPVIALDNTFRPDVVEIAVGDEVLWENRGLNEHNVLRVEGEGWGVEVQDFQPGDAYAHVFTEPGEYRYFCSIHGNTEVGMVGTVVVAG